MNLLTIEQAISQSRSIWRTNVGILSRLPRLQSLVLLLTLVEDLER
jgi:hypothetical protein